MPARGGKARRLTYYSINEHGDHRMLRNTPDNHVVGWTPDGKNVVFLSRRDRINKGMAKAYTVPRTGGLPTRLPIPWSGALTFGPDDHTLADNKLARRYKPFYRKHYYGGAANDMWTFDFESGRSRRITHWKGADGSGLLMMFSAAEIL